MNKKYYILFCLLFLTGMVWGAKSEVKTASQDSISTIQDSTLAIPDSVIAIPDSVLAVKDSIIAVKDSIITVKDTASTVKDTASTTQESSENILPEIINSPVEPIQNEPTKPKNKKKPTSGEGVKAWHINEDFAEIHPSSPDTLSQDFQITTTMVYEENIASEWLGNMGLPSQSAIFKQRHTTDYTGDFLFRHAYYDNYVHTDDVFFYNTKKPYSNISYATGGFAHHGEDHLTGLLSMNATPKFNLGLYADYIYGRGSFYNQSSDDLTGYVNGSYIGNKYSIHFIAGWNNFRNFENGGLVNDEALKPMDDPQNVPTRLSNAWSIYKSYNFWVNQQYNIGFNKIDPNDSEKSTFVPVMTVGWSIKFESSQKCYLEKSISPTFYEQNLYSNVGTRDTVSNFFLKNVVSFTFNEGFQKWAVFGLRLFVEADMDENLNMVGIGDSALFYHTIVGYNTDALVSVGGELFKRKGNTTYGVLGKCLVLGREKRVAFDVHGDFNSSWRLSKKNDYRMFLNAEGHVKNTNPSYYQEHYYSNHFQWDNHFENVWSAGAYAKIGIPYEYCDFSIGAGWQGLKNYIYFNRDAIPEQNTTDFIQVINADLKLNLKAWWLHLDTQLSYQYTSHPDVLPLPMLSLYSNFYLKTKVFKKLLTIQFGVDVRYNTAYYANAYMPATGQFHLQNETLVGDYPLMNIYLNLHLKQFRFFVMYYNLTQAWAKEGYFAAPHYPLNPGMFKCGLSWNFYD